MTDTLHLEIITAGGAVVDTPAAQVTLPLADGEVDAAQHVDLGLALAKAAAEVLHLEDVGHALQP